MENRIGWAKCPVRKKRWEPPNKMTQCGLAHQIKSPDKKSGLFIWWAGTESNRRHEDFQSSALPTELPARPKRGLIIENKHGLSKGFNLSFRRRGGLVKTFNGRLITSFFFRAIKRIIRTLHNQRRLFIKIMNAGYT